MKSALVLLLATSVCANELTKETWDAAVAGKAFGGPSLFPKNREYELDFNIFGDFLILDKNRLTE